nr:ankyrin repeat family protein [Tanacetum cinerariifolium]
MYTDINPNQIPSSGNIVKNRLLKAIRKDDWGKAREIVYNNTEEVTWTSKLNDRGDTALHYAVGRYKDNEVVRDVVLEINSELLLTIENGIGAHPAHLAAIFDVAYELINNYPRMAAQVFGKDDTPLLWIIRKPDLFYSGTDYNLYQRFVYRDVPIENNSLGGTHTADIENNSLGGTDTEDIENNNLGGTDMADIKNNSLGGTDTADVENQETPKKDKSVTKHTRRCLQDVIWRIWVELWKTTLLHVPHVKHLKEDKVKHNTTIKLLRLVCKEIKKKYTSSDIKRLSSSPFCLAVENNTPEAIEVLITYLVRLYDFVKDEHNVYQLTVLNRSEKVYSYILHHGHVTKTDFFMSEDGDGNNILHLAGRLAPIHKLNAASGAALQMQQELKWFEAVKRVVGITKTQELNKNKEIPMMEKQWILIPIGALACLPIASFVTLQFPLLVELVSSTYGQGIFVIWRIWVKLWEATLLHVPHVKHLQNDKVKHNTTIKLLRRICEEVDRTNMSSDIQRLYSTSFCLAVENNTAEAIDVLTIYFAVLYGSKKDGHNIYQLTVVNRSEKVYSFLMNHKHDAIWDLMMRIDHDDNNILHLAGRLAPIHKLNAASGAALQMQQELQWFEEVKRVVGIAHTRAVNIIKETPMMVFRREHEKLRKDGEEWMKKTADSYTITTALIITIVFAAAITVPGGNDDKSGKPIYETKPSFIIFAVADAISLFTATTSLLLFLSILTARYADEDFLYKLPKRLIIGLVMLFVSVTSMMIAFSATLYIMFGEGKAWVLIPIAALACLPVASFVTLQFPLLVELISSTYGHGMFGKEKDYRQSSANGNKKKRT